MNNIQIVTDSTAYIPKDIMTQKQIKVISLNVHFEGESFEEGYPDSFDAYYKRLAASTDFPKTSQPSSESFQKVFEEALLAGKEVIAIVISEKLSGTHNSAYAAAQMTDPEKISIIDSESTSANLRALVEMACQWADEGMTREDIVLKLNEQKHKMSIHLTVGTLEYLKRGGRLTGTKAAIATVLDIRPILALVEGELVPVGKGRGKTKTIEMMIKDIPQQVKHISVCHTANYDEAFKIMERLKEKYTQAIVQIDDIGPVIGSHLGPGVIGICSYW